MVSMRSAPTIIPSLDSRCDEGTNTSNGVLATGDTQRPGWFCDPRSAFCAQKPFFLTALFAGVAGFLLLGCRQEKNGRETKSRTELSPISVKVARVTSTNLDRFISVPGSIVAKDISTLSVKVSGRIKSIQVELGSVVQEGDLIAEIDARDYELRLIETSAELAQARARLSLPLDGLDDRVDPEQTSTMRQVKATLVEAGKKRERIESLSKQRILSESELETANAEYEVALNRYEDARAEVRLRQATLAQRRAAVEVAKQQLADTRIVAPFSGTIQERRSNLGEYTTAGTPLVTLIRLDSLRLRAEVPERESAKIHVGQLTRIWLEGSTNSTLVSVTRLSPAIHAENRTLTIEADVPVSAHFRPGAFVRADQASAIN